MGVEWLHDPDRAYELTTDNVKKILAIHMRFRYVSVVRSNFLNELFDCLLNVVLFNRPMTLPSVMWYYLCFFFFNMETT